jgi:hypothetical protein
MACRTCTSYFQSEYAKTFEDYTRNSEWLEAVMSSSEPWPFRRGIERAQTQMRRLEEKLVKIWNAMHSANCCNLLVEYQHHYAFLNLATGWQDF